MCIQKYYRYDLQLIKNKREIDLLNKKNIQYVQKDNIKNFYCYSILIYLDFKNKIMIYIL